MHLTRLLLNFMMVSPLIFGCSSSKEDEVVKEVNSFYIENNEKSFKIFDNWIIGVREGEKDLYVLDFVKDSETIKDRFIIKKSKDNLFIKRIYPNQESLFHALNKRDSLYNDYPFSDLYFRDLMLQFFSLKASKIMNIEDELFLIEKKTFSIIYSEKRIEDIQDKYQDYIKFNDHLWYFVTK